MQIFAIPAGSTSKDIVVSAYDSSVTTGAKLAGLVYNSGSLTAYYSRQGVSGAAVAISLVSKTKGTWTSGGFVAVDGTNAPGDYELGLPDAALAAGANWAKIQLRGAANMKPLDVVIDLSVKSAVSLVDDILDEVVEGTLTFRQLLRIFLAGIAGTTTDDGKEFYDITGAKKRIDGTVVGKNRTVSTLDGS